MRIQHNILAMNAYRNYNTNTSALAKNLEKLSSGYKINRAGDDAAGLAISEKMRAQITGLNAAQKNVKDGISLVKTAEGAMQEIQDMLNRMDYLATQSANGTYDDPVDRLNLQKEVDALKTEINRIADSANFNGIKLLDGSMDENVKAVTDTISTTTGGKSDVPILQDVATDPTAEVGDKTVLREPTPATGKTTIQIELGNVALTGKTGDEFTVKVGDTEIKLTVDANGTDSDKLKSDKTYTGKELADKIASAFQTQGGTINKQGFTVSAAVDANGNASVKFEQTNEPTTMDEVVGANVGVEFSHKVDPDGHATDYVLEIGNEDIKDGDFISIDGIKIDIDTDLATTFSAANGAMPTPDSDGFFKIGDYNVKYDSSTEKLTIQDIDGTAGKPEVKYESYSDPVKLAPTSVKGEDAVKAAYSVKVNTSGIYSKGQSQVYSSQITASGITAAVKQSNTFTITAGGTYDDGDTVTIAAQGMGTNATLTIGATGDISVADAADSAKLAAAIAGKINSSEYDVSVANNVITMTAKGAGALNSTGAPTGAASLTLTAGGSNTGSGTATSAAGTAVAGKAADTITVGSKTLTVVADDAATVGANEIKVSDANDATKIAALIAANTTNAGYDVSASGDKVIYTAKKSGTAGNYGAPAAVTTAPTFSTSGTGTANAAAIATDNGGVDPDKITIGGIDLVIGTDISAADASDANKLATALAEKLNGGYETNYTVTAENGSLVFTAKNGGEVGGTGTGPAAQPVAINPTISNAGNTNTNKGTLTFGNVTESTKGVDATKAYSEYDLSGLKEGDILTVNGKEFAVQANGTFANTDASDTTTFLAAVESQAGVSAGGATISADGKLKIEADDAGSNEAAPKATIRVKTKGETDATNQLDTPTGKETITGTWNVQSTVNKEGGPTVPSALASTAFTMDTNMVKDGNTLTIGKDTYVFKVGADSTVEAKDGQKLIDLSAFEADDANLVKNAAVILSNVTDNSAFNIGYDESATGDTTTAKITIHEKQGQTDYDKELQSVEEFDKLVYMTAPEVTTTEDVTTGFDGKPLTLQIGDTSDKFNQMQVSIGDMHTAAMGKGTATLDGEEIEVTKTIADIDISSLEGAQEAVAVIKNAINYVSSVRGDLGATQNRLEHTANNLSVMAENIQDAESTIRDTDIAEEMMAYTKNNILIQSAQAMLAQANAVPQGVLQLLG